MPYITIRREYRPHQITFEDVFRGITSDALVLDKDTKDTMTWYRDDLSNGIISKFDSFGAYCALKYFVEKYSALIDAPDKKDLYRSFFIPKRSGGLRRIDAPCDDLKDALRELKEIFEKCFFAMYHTSAFAYVKGRCAVDSVRRHQQNHSRWFLKLDFSGFFPSVTQDFTMEMFSKIFPFCYFLDSPSNRELFEKAISLCFLNGGLPQGAPTSPMLTNIIMIPIDYTISRELYNEHNKLCYTRYADDMLISSPYDFNWGEMVEKIKNILETFNAPMVLNEGKTRYGSSSGRNWNLGVMLNQNNDITIGYKKKKIFKAMLFKFMTDFTNNERWGVQETEHLYGLISYYRMINKSDTNNIILSYGNKFNADVEECIKTVIKENQRPPVTIYP